LHRWFDHELHKIRNDVMREPRADIEIGPDQWLTQPDWPSPDARDIPLPPGARGVLRPQRAPQGAAAAFPVAPGPRGRGSPERAAKGRTRAFAAAPGPRGQGYWEGATVSDPTAEQPFRTAFVSGPLPRSGRLSGTAEARIRVQADKPTANVTALLVDYGEDT